MTHMHCHSSTDAWMVCVVSNSLVLYAHLGYVTLALMGFRGNSPQEAPTNLNLKKKNMTFMYIHFISYFFGLENDDWTKEW